MPPVESIEWVAQGGFTIALLIAIWGLVTGKLITRRHHDDMLEKAETQNKDLKAELVAMKAERDQWVAHTLRLTKITGTAVEKMAVVQKVEE